MQTQRNVVVASETPISRLDFATLRPTDLRTAQAMQNILVVTNNNEHTLAHHRQFIRFPGELEQTEDRASEFDSGDTVEMSDAEAALIDSDDTVEMSNAEKDVIDSAPGYVLSLGTTVGTLDRLGAYRFGIGSFAENPTSGGVELLLPPLADDSSSSASSNMSYIQPHHGYFAFDAKYGQLWLHARHAGIRVGGDWLSRGEKILLLNQCPISVGPYNFNFEFRNYDEETYRLAKNQWLVTHGSAGNVFESTSRTPSVKPRFIGDWQIQQPIGRTREGLIIYSATHTKTGEVVAYKRLYDFTEEGAVYVQMTDNVQGHRYYMFIMRLRDMFKHGEGRDLLWTPLARSDFRAFKPTGKYHGVSVQVKKILFVQILLGVSALHEKTWIHRDLEPGNLGVGEVEGEPFAFIMDFSQALMSQDEPNPDGTFSPDVYNPDAIDKYGIGRLGYRAPELEGHIVSSYSKEVDIWSMGAVGYYLFVNSKLPWKGCEYNMFQDLDRPDSNPCLQQFQAERLRLLGWPAHTLEHLLGTMLTEDPRQRPSMETIFDHPQVRPIKERIDRQIDREIERTGVVGNPEVREFTCDN